jgi:hypothetical protein
MHKRLAFWVTLLTLLTRGLQAQPAPSCHQVFLTGSVPVKVQGPTQADHVRVVDGAAKLVGDLEFSVSSGLWNAEEKMLTRIDAALKARTDTRSDFRLNWIKGNSLLQSDAFELPGDDPAKVCPSPPPPQPLPLAPGSGPSGGPGIAVTSTTENSANIEAPCREKFNSWVKEISGRLPRGHFLAMLFGLDGRVLDENKSYGVSGDLVYTAVCVDGSFVANPRLEFTKCDLQSPIPKNPEGDTLPFKTQSNAPAKLVTFPTRQCFGTSVVIKITGVRLVGPTNAPNQLNETHTIGFYERYRYTIEVAALSTSQHVHTFGLRKDGDQMKIFDKGPTNSGPEYMASVVLYAIPRYFQQLTDQTRRGEESLEGLASRTYYGRDVVNEHGLLDRIGLVVGAGLNSPNDRFAVGLSFELVPGVNLAGVYEFARLKELAGVGEGDAFTGTAPEIPIRDTWNRKVVFGLSLDMRFVTGLFKRGS